MFNWLNPLWVINNLLVCYWSGAASIVGGIIGSDSADTAAEASQSNTNATIAAQKAQAAQNRADLTPYREAGNAANSKLADYLGLSTVPVANRTSNYGTFLNNFTANDMANDPVYNSGLQFGLDQGMQGLNRQAAAGGSLNSGSTLKALTKYANDYASTKAQQSYNNFNTNKTNNYSMLSGVATNGQNAANQTAANGSASTNAIAAALTNNANNQGNAAIASGTAWNNAINGGIGSYLYNNRIAPANASISSVGGINNYASGNGQYSTGTPWYLQ